MIYAVTGSTGGLGRLAISHLLTLGIKPSSIIALARDAEKASDLQAKGVEVRIGTYNDKASLEQAFKGVDRVLLVSSSEIGQRLPQHQNVIEAAKASGVKQIIYTSLTRADVSSNPLAPDHKATEAALKESGLEYVILRNNWYTENYTADVQFSGQSGVIAAAAQDGKVSSATKSDYAEAAAKVLSTEGHAGKIYELAGTPWDYKQLASAAGKIHNREVVYKHISIEEKKNNLIQAAGMDDQTAGFFAIIDDSIAKGTLDITSKDLENILGRKPLSLEEGLRSVL